MQDKYVGDFGDFVKYGLLRHLSEGKQLGVAWYLHPNEEGPDGRKLGYLKKPDIWKPLDRDLFNGLNTIVQSESRSVAALESSSLLNGAKFTNERLETDLLPSQWRQRRKWRADWFNDVVTKLQGCKIIFTDPDNGLCLDKRYRPSRAKYWKRLPLAEALNLSTGRTAVLYHHNTRRPGGHRKEIRYWMKKLPHCVGAFYCNTDGFRTFFVISDDDVIKRRLDEFAKKWARVGELIPPGGVRNDQGC
ncbi:MAG: hypothetical protein F4X64_16315 [Chloroflexi bacterium]|nr:hypothetical protein [Chloroflexota bacterium]